MEAEVVTVALSDGAEEEFGPGLGGVPSHGTEDELWPWVVRYAIDPSGALLVGYGAGTLLDGVPVEVGSLRDFDVRELTVVKTFAPGRWTSVSGGDYWRYV